MFIWFFISVLGVIAVVPLHFLSLEHMKLENRYGKERGTKISEIYGLISGWGLFFFWIGIWISPQPRFTFPIFPNPSVYFPEVSLSISLLQLTVFTSFLIPSVWFAIKGVKETTLRVAETHRTGKIVTTGVYSIVRHPQYLGGLLAHVGISFLLSARYSLLLTLLMVTLVYLISRKEEEELIREFGREYEDYRKRVPMLIPRLRK